MGESKKLPVLEYNAEKLLEDLEMSREQFVDMCILLGCDYCDSIKGIGPKKAFELITKHKSIEEILKVIDKEKYKVPDPFPFEGARDLFFNPDVTDPEEVI